MVVRYSHLIYTEATFAPETRLTLQEQMSTPLGPAHLPALNEVLANNPGSYRINPKIGHQASSQPKNDTLVVHIFS
jgi:hypothetical protein